MISAEGVTREDVVAVARGRPAVRLDENARRAMERSAAVVAALAESGEPAYGVSTGFGSLAQTRIPADRRTELQRALIRSHAAGMGPPIEREAVRAMFLLRARSLAMGFSGARPELAETIARDARRGARSGGSRARVARRQRRSGPARPLRAGDDRGGRGARRRRTSRPRRGGARASRDRAAGARAEGGLGADQRHRRHPRDADPRSRRPRPAPAPRRRRRRGEHRGAARNRPRLRRGPDRPAPAARAGRERGQPAPAARRLGDRRQPSHRRPAGPGRVLDPLQPAGQRRRPRHRRPRRAGGRGRAGFGDRQPDGPARRPGRVVRQLPRCSGRDGLRLPRDRRGRGRRDQRAAHRPPARPVALPRPARLPGSRRGGRLGPDDRPVHAGGDGGREPPPGGAGVGRFAADLGDAGGPRLDGLGGRAQAARVGRQPEADARGRAHLRLSGDRAARPARAGGRDRSRARGTARRRRRHRARTAGSRPSCSRPSGCSATAPCSPRSTTPSGDWNERPARGSRPARRRAQLPRLGPGGARCGC